MVRIFNASNIATLLLSLPAVLWAITFHEFCHGYVANLLGDPTARLQGRLTLNPLAHLDIIGALMLLFFRFGWAKPVPIDPRYFKHPKRDLVLVSLAGAGGNLLTAFVCGFLGRMAPQIFLSNDALSQVMLLMVVMNVALAVFNLIPIPPLDGSKLLYLVLPPRFMEGYFWLERYGMIVLLILVVSGGISFVMNPIVSLLVQMAL